MEKVTLSPSFSKTNRYSINNPTLILCLNDSIVIDYKTKKHKVLEGESHFIFPEVFKVINNKKSEYISIEFGQYFIKFSSNCGESMIKGISNSWDEVIEIKQYIKIVSIAYNNEKILLLTKLILLSLKDVKDISNYDNELKTKKRFKNFYKLLSCFQDNLKKNICINSVSNYTGLHKNRLNKISREFRNLSVKSLYNLVRFEAVREDLINNSCEIKTIVEDYKFTNYDYFIQQFKQLYNITPFKLRKESKMNSHSELIHYTNGFSQLKPSPSYDVLKSRYFENFIPQNSLIICNIGNEPLDIYWINHLGERYHYARLLVNHRKLFGTEKGQYWLISGKEQIYYLTPNFNSIIIH